MIIRRRRYSAERDQRNVKESLSHKQNLLLAVVGANIRRVRIGKRRSVEWLAIECDCTDEFIEAVEDGMVSNVAFTKVARIATVLGIDLSALPLRGGREAS